MIFRGRNRVTQPYCYPRHWGIDLVGMDDWSVCTPADGVVEQISWWDGQTKSGTQSYGNLVILRTPDRLLYFAHLDTVRVRPGQRLHKSDSLGIMGNTGNSFGAHTHFEVRSLNRRQFYNPAAYLGIPNEPGVYLNTGSGPLRGFYTIGSSLYYFTPKMLITDERGNIHD